jgi:hypothetical protein
MRVVVYANCQVGPIHRLIERAAPQLEVVRTLPVHTLTPADLADVHALMLSADIVLAQPIGANFGPLASDKLRQVSGAREWITFPSIYFGGLFPHLIYLRQHNRIPLRGPLTDYHDRRIIKSYLAGHSVEDCARHMNDGDVTACRQHFHEAVEESIEREAALPIQVMDYVIENVTHHRTFHTFNHPDNGVMWHVVKQFLHLLQLPMAVDSPPVNQYLNEVSAAIPEEMSKAIGLKFVDDEYRLFGKLYPREILIEDFYSIYDATTDFQDICQANLLTVK